MSDYRYRYKAARGLERRQVYLRHWESVTGRMFEAMTSDELRKCADAMDRAPTEDPAS